MKFIFGTIMRGIAPNRNAIKARFLDLFLLRSIGREKVLVEISVRPS
jgi:hypothetical protein